MQLTEDEMRRALGLEPVAKTKANVRNEEVVKEKRIYPHILVTYSVRSAEGGPTRKFEFKSRSISMDMAKLEAEKEIKRQGLVVWALLDIEQFS